jgi:hypothetical protein
MIWTLDAVLLALNLIAWSSLLREDTAWGECATALHFTYSWGRIRVAPETTKEEARD